MTDSASTAVPLSQPLYGASLGQAVSRFFSKYATFSGRASRSEYWWVVLFIALVNLVFSILFAVLGGKYTPDSDGMIHIEGVAVVIVVIWGLFGLAILIPHIALTVRRLHDANFAGWFYLFTVFGLGLVTFILTLLPSKPEGARFDK